MIKLRSKHLICGLLATTVLATPALAQVYPEADFVPPVRQTVDDNGVNLADGFMTVTAPGITIGSGGQGLSYHRTLNQSGTLTAGWDNPYHYAVSGTPGTTLTVAFAGQSVEFTFDSGTSLYVNKNGSGETLTGSGTTWTFTARDGTVVQMDAAVFNAGADVNAAIAVGRTITLPNNQKLTLNYKEVTGYKASTETYTSHVRVQSVQSSSGYMAKLEYADNSTWGGNWIRVTKATLLNNAVDYCNPTADSCTFSQAWPSLTFTDNGAGTQTVTDALSRTTTYNTSGGLTAVRRPGSATDNVTIAHDATGKVSSVARDGRTWTYSWSLAAPLMTATTTNPDQSQEVIVTDTTIGQVKSAKDELNRTTLYDYDANGRLWLVTYPEGNKLQYTYDSRGNVTEQRAISKTPGTPVDIVISASYSASCANALTCNKPNYTTDTRGNVTDFTFDPTHGGVLTVKAPAVSGVRPETRYSYATRQAYFKNSAGSIVASGQSTYLLTGVSTCQTQTSCTGAVDEIKTTIDYGPQTTGTANNLLAVSVSKGAGDATLPVLQTNSYDWVGNVTYVDGALSGNADVSRTIYDAGRQVIGQISPDPDGGSSLPNRASRATYNVDGQITKLEQGTTPGQSDTNWSSFAPAETIDVKYDAAGRVIEQKLSGSGGAVALTQASYDLAGRPVCSAVRMNTAAYGSLPTSACMLGAQGSFGPDQITRTVYDAAGQVMQLQTGVGTASQANEQTLTYSNNGKLKTLKDAENNLTTYVYDGHDRLSQTQYPSSNPKGAGTSNTGDYEQLTYETTGGGTRTSGTVASFRNRAGEVTNFTYDYLNRLTLKNLPGSTEPDVSYRYDNLGRLTQTFQKDSAGVTVQDLTFTYDAMSRLIQQSGPLGTTDFEYDVAGRRTKLDYPGTGLFMNYDYLVTGEMTKIRENGATTGIGVLASYTYDSLGRKTSLTFGNGNSQTYEYDPVGRLAGMNIDLAGTGTADDLLIGKVGATGTATAYNPASQIVSQVRSNQNDAYAWNSAVAVNNPYTSNGLNQLTQSGSAMLSYTDNRGNLTSDGSTTYGYNSENMLISASTGVSLSYDPLMRLYEVTSASGTRRFAYDGTEILTERDENGVFIGKYVWGPGVDEPLVQYDTAGTRTFLHADERGSIIAVSDASGNSFAKNSYDEYGIPGSGNYGRFQYTGQVWLPELGMYHYKARIYSPSLGRFLQTDPIGYGDGMNVYAYVGNDPINFVDPLGLITDTGISAGQLAYGHGAQDDNSEIVVTATLPAGHGISGGGMGNGGSSGGENGGRDIVVTGRRGRVISVLKTAGSLVVPGWDLGACAFGGGCSGSDWGWAIADLGGPAGKLLSKGRKGWKLFKAAKRSCGCLEAGTLIATPNGLVPIETIEIGDLVLAINEKTGEVAPKPVTALIRPEPKPLYRLDLDDAGGEKETFHATDDHPWKVEGKGWVETASLKPGDRIDTGSGADMLVTGLALTERVERTFNLTVADFHTFMVGEDQVVVHNSKCDKQRKGTPGNNQAQNKMFADATRGLTKEQKRIVHDEISGRDMTFQEIQDISNAVRNRQW